MSIPQSLKVGGHTITVRFAELDNCGDFDRETLTIRISNRMARSQQESTFFHELLHVINNELDHELLDSLAEQLYQVLVDNSMLR